MAKSGILSWVVVTAASAGAGALYSILFNSQFEPRSIVYGLCIGLMVVYYERGTLTRSHRERVRNLPTLAYLLSAEASLLIVVLIGTAASGLLVWSLGWTDDTLAEAATPSLTSLLYSMVAAAVFVFMFRIRDLIGGEILASLVLGRYHRPISEERVFLFLDLVGSTAYARDHGDLAAQELLKAIFAAVAAPIRHHKGQVDDYIGDQVIISWPIQRGLEDAQCVACVFAIFAELERSRSHWIAKFSKFPELRAALHGGQIVTAEVGVDRHKIAYFGDVMNTTARLEQLCRQTGELVVISEVLVRRFARLPNGVAAKPLGQFDLRGRGSALTVYSLARSG